MERTSTTKALELFSYLEKLSVDREVTISRNKLATAFGVSLSRINQLLNMLIADDLVEISRNYVPGSNRNIPSTIKLGESE